MSPQITTRIVSRDNLEIVRDQIAAIIKLESDGQQALAVAENEDPQPWALRVFTERTNCWGYFTSNESTDDDATSIDPTPIVSVWVDSVSYDKKRSVPSQRQQASAKINIDIYGCGVSAASERGHDSGDEVAAREVQRAYRLVRNILMSDVYVSLGMLGVVADRWPESFEMLKPGQDKTTVESVDVGRLVLDVSFNEFSPEYEGEPLELISAGVKRKEDGELYFTANLQIGV